MIFFLFFLNFIFSENKFDNDNINVSLNDIKNTFIRNINNDTRGLSYIDLYNYSDDENLFKNNSNTLRSLYIFFNKIFDQKDLTFINDFQKNYFEFEEIINTCYKKFHFLKDPFFYNNGTYDHTRIFLYFYFHSQDENNINQSIKFSLKDHIINNDILYEEKNTLNDKIRELNKYFIYYSNNKSNEIEINKISKTKEIINSFEKLLNEKHKYINKMGKKTLNHYLFYSYPWSFMVYKKKTKANNEDKYNFILNNMFILYNDNKEIIESTELKSLNSKEIFILSNKNDTKIINNYTQKLDKMIQIHNDNNDYPIKEEVNFFDFPKINLLFLYFVDKYMKSFLKKENKNYNFSITEEIEATIHGIKNIMNL